MPTLFNYLSLFHMIFDEIRYKWTENNVEMKILKNTISRFIKITEASFPWQQCNIFKRCHKFSERENKPIIPKVQIYEIIEFLASMI